MTQKSTPDAGTILRQAECLLAVLPDPLSRVAVERIGAELLQGVQAGESRFVVLDFSMVESIDHATAMAVQDLVRVLHLMGVRTGAADFLPQVAAAWVSVGVELPVDVFTARANEAISQLRANR